jgi:hypothetical protein
LSVSRREQLYTLVGEGVLGLRGPLAQLPIDAGRWAYPQHGELPTVFAVPRAGGGFEWVPWEEAVGRGWCERAGRAEYVGDEGRRFVVLYCPAGRRAGWQLWKPRSRRPLRMAVCASEAESLERAERFLPRRQAGFWWPLEGGQVQGWDDRELGDHECCAGPERGHEHVLVVEFPDAAAAARPHIVLERDAWLESLTVARAVALSGCPDGGGCQPRCLHCSASLDEVEAAWEWLEAHPRQVRAFERAARRQGGDLAQEEAATW